MADGAVAGGRTAWRGRLGTVPAAARPPLDVRRALQLALAAIWLLDGVLQFQGFMFTKGFSQMLAGTADGNPTVIAKPITWDANLIGHHMVALNAVFATIQLLLGLGIAYRPTARVALAASVLWSLGVWWFGEGLGGVLSGTASPLNGAPGAVILYALLAVLLWPADREVPAPFTAARAVGARVARALWAVLWLSLAYFALTPGNRAPQGVSGMIADMESGEPVWLGPAEGRGVAGRRPGAGCLGRPGGRAGADRRRGLPAGQDRQGRPSARHRGGRVHLGVRAGSRRRPGQRRDRRQLRPAARPAGVRLLAAGNRSADPGSRARGQRRAHNWRRGCMMTPAWILDIFAAIMLVVAAVSAARLVAARPWRRGAVVTDSDISHLLMGIAMAGVLAPGLATLPDGAWAAVFGVLTAWFGYRLVRDYQASGARALAAGHCAPHLVHSAAMIYMFLAITVPAAGGAGMTGMGAMSGMSTLSVPTLAFFFALLLAGYTIWDLDQLYSLQRGLVAGAAGAAAPALAGAATGIPGSGIGAGAVAGPGAGGMAADSPAGSGRASRGDATGGGRSGSVPVLDSVGTVVGCRIAMGVTMALMLFLMI
jgi:hypothetical protein